MGWGWGWGWGWGRGAWGYTFPLTCLTPLGNSKIENQNQDPWNSTFFLHHPWKFHFFFSWPPEISTCSFFNTPRNSMSYVAVLNDQIPILGTRLPYIKKYMKMHTLLAQTYLKFLKGKKVLKSQLIKKPLSIR